MTALRALLHGIVDYAGLFPPASLDMQSAVDNYARYRLDDGAWMLGRFIVPVARLDTLSAALPAAERSEWRIAGLLGADVVADVVRVRAFNDAEAGKARVDTLEAKLDSVASIERAATEVGGEVELFAEIPTSGDLTALVDAIKRAGIKAKIRTGGVIADAIPAPESVVRFIRACLNAGVAFKATAGLHHPLRAEYRLTYDPGSPSGVMFGYLNVFLAAAFMANGLTDFEAIRLLDERDAAAFDFDADGVRWCGHSLTARQVADARERVATSFGSCSFREPVDELRALAPS